MSCSSEEWEDYRKDFRPIYEHLCSKIKDLTQPLSLPESLEENRGCTLKTLQYISHYGLQSLSRVPLHNSHIK